MTDYEQLGYYECDDEADDGEIDYGEYYQDGHIHFPQASSHKSSVNYYEYHNPSAYNNAENISSSSAEEHFVKVPQSNKNYGKYGQYEDTKLEPKPINYPYSNREKYFTNHELEMQDSNELLTITVEIGNGEQENIVIMNNDTAEEVVERF